MFGVGDHYAAIATHDFKGRDSHELTFSKGHTLRVAPKNLQPPNVAPGWLLAVNSTDGGTQDSLMLPYNYPIYNHGKFQSAKVWPCHHIEL